MSELPLPPHFTPAAVDRVRRVPYQALAAAAEAWALEHRVPRAAADDRRVCVMLVDVQNTFCLPDFELFVRGRSGTGAVDDTVRLCSWLYRNLAAVTEIVATLDTHQAIQIFHSIALVDADGRHPEPYPLVSAADVERGRWRFNPAAAQALGMSPEEGQAHLRHYARRLAEGGKYELTVWPYHSMLGGVGHALVAAVEEAVFFHSVARVSQPRFELKGQNPRTEHYSVLGPEVLAGADGRPLEARNDALVERLLAFDAVVIAGQAKSHCVAWTIEDLLDELRGRDPALVRKVVLLEDCTSPVVVPGAVDYTAQADAAFARFAEAGVHVTRTTEPLEEWPLWTRNGLAPGGRGR